MLLNDIAWVAFCSTSPLNAFTAVRSSSVVDIVLVVLVVALVPVLVPVPAPDDRRVITTSNKITVCVEEERCRCCCKYRR